MFPAGKFDFDAWGYNMTWPQDPLVLPLMDRCSVAVEDIKFAFNAWMLLRLCMFYGLPHPKVMSALRSTTPTMDIMERGNRLFYMHSTVDAPLSLRKTKIALTPSDPRAVSLIGFDWKKAAAEHPDGVEIVLGMENGMSDEVVQRCDHCVFIPQYGSIGSLSMLSALSIAVHHAHSSLHPAASATGLHISPKCLGHKPGTSGYAPPSTRLPHEPAFLNFTNEEIIAELSTRRRAFPLQLSILIRNEIADRNIGATMRNANVYNCEHFVIINRRKFNVRGTVGTHHVTSLRYYDSMEHMQQGNSSDNALDGYELWLIQSHYPYLQNFYVQPDEEPPARWIQGKKGVRREFATFTRPEDAALQRWVAHPDVWEPDSSGRPHPMKRHLKEGIESSTVFLDDELSIDVAVSDVHRKGKRGIALMFPEEGTTPHPEIAKAADRLVFVTHPKRMCNSVQRGLTPALASSVALERLRNAIDKLVVNNVV